ncbi:hypothetical protein FIBSPDRAFT_877244 [Athelia psychrophila]|uniref:Uncharacterized protein n=1 Tax=Athelia psychrophila TaxID=1759441 RepID=A0A167W592_9AGAM|nr:hypothetical protein FIBSPDRAFT_877244 [Fibularhizoctonia sp. CBS 109695]
MSYTAGPAAVIVPYGRLRRRVPYGRLRRHFLEHRSSSSVLAPPLTDAFPSGVLAPPLTDAFPSGVLAPPLTDAFPSHRL